jgi:hypothetical protein
MLKKQIYTLVLCAALVNAQFATPEKPGIRNVTAEGDTRDGKLLNLFSVIKFPNDICSGGSKNGTCYTAEECENIGGTNDGSCASGFGVCCTLTLSCGGSSSQNCTYIEQSSTTSLSTNPCMYTINKASDSICRIKFDFTTFSIETPQTGSVASPSTATSGGPAIGDCTGDMFTITSPGNVAPPMICGFNTGQHMYVDASDAGHVASFFLSTSSTTSRFWSMKVYQYECNGWGAGPQGCLQYFTASTGTVASFNFPTTSSSTTSTVTHLSNQHYAMCFRRVSGYCAICFTPTRSTPSAVIAQATFGVSVSPSSSIAQSAIDGTCTSDYVGIVNGVTAAIAAISTVTTPGLYRVCGRVWAATAAQAISSAVSVCSRTRPFRLNFYTDADETVTTANMADSNELDEAPGGTVGFSLDWTQISC